MLISQDIQLLQFVDDLRMAGCPRTSNPKYFALNGRHPRTSGPGSNVDLPDRWPCSFLHSVLIEQGEGYGHSLSHEQRSPDPIFQRDRPRSGRHSLCDSSTDPPSIFRSRAKTSATNVPPWEGTMHRADRLRRCDRVGFVAAKRTGRPWGGISICRGIWLWTGLSCDIALHGPVSTGPSPSYWAGVPNDQWKTGPDENLVAYVKYQGTRR